jgi:glutaminase
VKQPTPTWLVEYAKQIEPLLEGGNVSQYLPQLAEAKNSDFGVALFSGGEDLIRFGYSGSFTIQSVIKVLTLLMAIGDFGEEETFRRAGSNPAVAAYNSIFNYDVTTGSTANPFVNAGALVTLDMIAGGEPSMVLERILECVRHLTGNPDITVNMDVATTEYELSDRNRAIGFHLLSHGAISTPVEDLLWLYCQACAIEVNVSDLARFAYTMSQREGISSEVLSVSAGSLTAVRRLLLSIGMYEDSAKYAREVGVPSKCGVSGSMIAIIPGVAGVGLYGPALDQTGNSLGGIEMMKLLSNHFDIT